MGSCRCRWDSSLYLAATSMLLSHPVVGWHSHYVGGFMSFSRGLHAFVSCLGMRGRCLVVRHAGFRGSVEKGEG